MPPDTYLDGFLIPVSRDQLETYRAAAELSADIWLEHGAIAYHETTLDDGSCHDMRSFIETAGASPEEIVVFAYAVFPSKEARDAANLQIMNDPRLSEMGERMKQVFDCTRMSYGGFRTLVSR